MLRVFPSLLLLPGGGSCGAGGKAEELWVGLACDEKTEGDGFMTWVVRNRKMSPINRRLIFSDMIHGLLDCLFLCNVFLIRATSLVVLLDRRILQHVVPRYNVCFGVLTVSSTPFSHATVKHACQGQGRDQRHHHEVLSAKGHRAGQRRGGEHNTVQETQGFQGLSRRRGDRWQGAAWRVCWLCCVLPSQPNTGEGCLAPLVSTRPGMLAMFQRS